MESRPIGHVLRRRRRELGISLRAAAYLCELSPGHLSLAERDRARLSAPALARVATTLRMSIRRIFEEAAGG